MTFPDLPAQGSTVWYPWAQAVHTSASGAAQIADVDDATTPSGAAVKAAIDNEVTTGTFSPTGSWNFGGATVTGVGSSPTIANLPAGATLTVRQNSDSSWPARPTTRQDLFVDWRFSVAGSAAPPAATTPGTTTDGTYPGDAIFGA